MKNQEKCGEQSPKTLAFAPTSIKMHMTLEVKTFNMYPLAFLYISPFCHLLSPLPYSRKTVLFVYIMPKAQKVCRLVSAISQFSVFLLL